MRTTQGLNDSANPVGRQTCATALGICSRAIPAVLSSTPQLYRRTSNSQGANRIESSRTTALIVIWPAAVAVISWFEPVCLIAVAAARSVLPSVQTSSSSKMCVHDFRLESTVGVSTYFASNCGGASPISILRMLFEVGRDNRRASATSTPSKRPSSRANKRVR